MTLVVVLTNSFAPIFAVSYEHDENILYYNPDIKLNGCGAGVSSDGSCSALASLRTTMWDSASESDHLRFMNVVAKEDYGLAAVEAYMNQVVSKYGSGNDGSLASWLNGQCTKFMSNGAEKCSTLKNSLTDQDKQLIDLALSGSNAVQFAVGNSTGGSTVGAGKIVCVWKQDQTKPELGSCRDDVDLSKEGGNGKCNVYAPSADFGECWGLEGNAAWASQMESTCIAEASNGSNVTIIGDSITEGSKTAILAKMPNATIDSKVGRHWSEGIEIAKNTALRSTVIFALGTNDGLTQAQIDTAISTIGATRKIIFMTDYSTGSGSLGSSNNYTSNNALIQQAVTAHANVSLMDWSKAAGADPSKYISGDGIHPTSSGQTVFADIMYKAVVATINSSIPSAEVTGGGTVAVGGNSAAQKIWSGLIAGGMTPEQAAGTLGNMKHEGILNPAQWEQPYSDSFNYEGDSTTRLNGSGAGIGLIQWSFGRRVKVIQAMKEAGVYDIVKNNENYGKRGYVSGDKFIELAGNSAGVDKLYAVQVQFLIDELRSVNSYSGIFEAKSVEEATRFFLEHVEKPANPTLENHPQRLTSANEFYAMYQSGELTGGCVSNFSGDLSAVILAYAWPDKKGQGWVQRMPEYANAVTRAKGEGRYVGGTVMGQEGIDCGGFVTRALQDSGLEPDYNGPGYASNVSGGQYPWIQARISEGKWRQLTDAEVNGGMGLLPGDVAISKSLGHTWMYVGDIPGFSSKFASASYTSTPHEAGHGRAPMAGSYDESGGDGTWWFRKVSN
jgi:hypothetical protein